MIDCSLLVVWKKSRHFVSNLGREVFNEIQKLQMSSWKKQTLLQKVWQDLVLEKCFLKNLLVTTVAYSEFCPPETFNRSHFGFNSL